nr:hypothetical protein CFP56_11913 [Quercus suber]
MCGCWVGWTTRTPPADHIQLDDIPNKTGADWREAVCTSCRMRHRKTYAIAKAVYCITLCVGCMRVRRCYCCCCCCHQISGQQIGSRTGTVRRARESGLHRDLGGGGTTGSVYATPAYRLKREGNPPDLQTDGMIGVDQRVWIWRRSVWSLWRTEDSRGWRILFL